ncbi:unnamed protein product [Hymenolepis diminuta]|uniref:Secreted protein n=1 Tax=Hymenolepis diminuta TaxID=6216 RepID=A0A0R3SLX8_HYMDI|nr:unnamed protein product [Hymenolepis diminuta]
MMNMLPLGSSLTSQRLLLASLVFLMSLRSYLLLQRTLLQQLWVEAILKLTSWRLLSILT